MSKQSTMTPASATSRRALLAGAASASAMLCAPGAVRSAFADIPTVSMMGVETAALDDWTPFQKATGVNVDFHSIDDDMGVFHQQIVANSAGDQIDIFIMDGGIQVDLGPQGFFMPLDVSKIPSWSKIPVSVSKSPQVMGPNGVLYGLPAVINADSFGYYPEDIGEEEPLSLALLFESEKTLGKVALEDNWLTTLPTAATYLKVSKGMAIGDPSNMTPSEAKAVVDFLIARKKAGQFRSLWTAYDESVDLLLRKEVIVENCWEPAIKDLLKAGKNVKYAYTKEGYNKWMVNAYVAKQVASRGNEAAVYAALEGFLSGAYAANIALLRGYGTALPARGLEYGKTHGMSAADIASLNENIRKVDVKFKAKWFWQNGAPTSVTDIESEWDRFRQD